ncbi:glucose-1-phosphate adenylyltransferase [bacterium]|nr:glucose-1-phosphate adenylyltransferase [candidate division CSSED10-310 bacterium]
MGGGRGTRLYPLTRNRAKPAVPLAGQYRLIDIPISNCINSGMKKIYILTQFLTTSLHKHVYKTYQFDIFSQGFLELLPAEQTITSSEWYQGTADAVRRQMHRFLHTGAEEALILAGDHLYRMDYREFLGFHRDTGADCTLAAIPVGRRDVSSYGILKADGEYRVTRFHEKPTDPGLLTELKTRPEDDKPWLASMGIYVFRMSELVKLLNENPKADFGRDIIPDAIKNRRVFAYPFKGYWADIGSISVFYETNISLTRFDAPFDFYDQHKPIYTRSRFLPASWAEKCRLDRAVICSGSRLQNAEVEESIIGLRSVVRSGAYLKRVVMMGADFFESDHEKETCRSDGVPPIGVGRNTRIDRAIIDKNARIGNDVMIRSHQGEPDLEKENYVIRDGIVVIPKNSVIPSGSRI